MKYLVDSDWVVDYLIGKQHILPLNRSIMQRFARIRGDLRRKGQIIGDPDILIAATALYHNLTLLTRNRKHYGRIPMLKVEFPAH